MKIRYSVSGDISACCIDSQSLGGATVVTIPDNADLLANPNKYTWDAANGNLILRKAVVMSTSAPSAAANGIASVVVNLAAMNTSGASDLTANYTVMITDLNDHASVPVSVTLSAGAGSASYTSSKPKRMMLSAQSAGVCGGALVISFS